MKIGYRLKLLDTFAGIGGFSYAAEKLVGGFETTQFVEIDPFCQKVLKKHWPHVPIHDDITTFSAKPFQYDVICGGFPCQSISQSGTREGITETSKSGLWFQLLKTIRMVRPKYFILENVSAILSNGLDIVLRDIYETGFYECEWATYPASYLGAAHQRDRWYLLGISTDPYHYGHKTRCSKTRNKVTTRKNSQSKWSADTENIKRQSNDEFNSRKSRINENLSRSSNGRKATSSYTERICDLSEEANNDQGTSNKNNYQKNNDRALVSEGQSRVQLSQHRELGGDKTTSENISIRHGDDNSKNKGMDDKKSDVANTNSIGCGGGSSKGCSVQERQLFQKEQTGCQMGSEIERCSLDDHRWRNTKHRLDPNWKEYGVKPTIYRNPNGVSSRLDKNRSHALGNSLVPQAAALPLQRIIDLEKKEL